MVLVVGVGKAQAATPQFSCTATGATAATKYQTKAVAGDSGDDTPAIQQAIDRAAATGGVVVLPAGIFLLNGHLVMKDGVALTGVGPSTVLKAGSGFLRHPGPAGGYPVVTTAGARNVTIANLTADQSGDVLNGNVSTRLTEYLVDVRNSSNVVINGVRTRNPFTYSIAVVASTNFCVLNSSTSSATKGRYDQLDGIHILDSSNGRVLNNVVDQGAGTDGDDGLVAHTMGREVKNVLYANNTVRGGRHGAGMQFALGNYGISNVQVFNNVFWGHPIGVHDGYWDGGNAKMANIRIAGNAFDRTTKDAAMFTGTVSGFEFSGNYLCNARTSGFQLTGKNYARCVVT